MNKYSKKLQLNIIEKDKRNPVVKLFKTALKLAAITAIVFPIGFNFAREIKEEITSQNTIVDFNFGFINTVLHNKETRTTDEVLNSIIQAALNVEGIEDAYNNKFKTEDERKAFLTKFVDEINKSAGLNFNIVYKDELIKDSQATGLFYGGNYNGMSFSKNEIYIHNSYVKNPDVTVLGLMQTAFHEMVHATEYTNLLTNKSIKNLNLKLYSLSEKDFEMNKEIYQSKFIEINAFLTTANFTTQLNQKFGNKSEIISTEYIPYEINNILRDAINYDMKLNNRVEDFYNRLTVKEVFDIAFTNAYNSKGVEIPDSFEGEYIYDILRFNIPDYMFNISYNDIKYQNYQHKNLDLQTEYYTLSQTMNLFKQKKFADIVSIYEPSREVDASVAESVAKKQIIDKYRAVFAILKYDSNNYDSELLNDTYNLLLNNKDFISSYTAEMFCLQQQDFAKVLEVITAFKTNNQSSDFTM